MAAAPLEKARVLAAIGVALVSAVILMLFAVYSQRLVLDLPLFAIDEGAYLIKALLSREMLEHPSFVIDMPVVDNTVFIWILRGLGELTPSVLEAARVVGAAAYFLGLVLIYRAVRPQVQSADRLVLVLLILVFPFHRFVFTALPEGWYVGVLGVMTLITARLYRSRPLRHALAMGCLTAVLILIKPHGVAVAIAFLVAAVIDFAISSKRQWPTLALRTLIYLAAIFAVGNLIQGLEGRPLSNGLFFGHGYDQALSASITPDTALNGAKTLLCMIFAVGLLAGVPIVLGVADIARRWRGDRDSFCPGPADLTFLFNLLGLMVTLAMVTVFAMKISAIAATEADRLWGRYFEFFVPILWLTAMPAISRWRSVEGRGMRPALAAVVGLSALGLVFCILGGVMVFPWDAAALSAFFRPDPARWQLPNMSFPVFAFAASASILAAMLTLTRVDPGRIWLGFFATLAVLSSVFDEAWVRDILPARQIMGLEVGGARLLVRASHGPAVVFYDDPNMSRCIVLRLKAGAQMVLVVPGESLNTSRFEGFDTVVVQGAHPVVGQGWSVVQPGALLQVYGRPK